MESENQVRWGVLGTAEIARAQVIPAINATSNGAVTAVSSSSGRAAAFAGPLGIPAVHSSHEELLANPAIDAVYIPLPNSLHAQWAIRAANAGKHVLCEKPIAMNLQELEQLESACVAGGVQYAEAFMYRHHPQYGKLQELITAGAIGDLVAINARLHFKLDRSGADIRLDPALGGGALRDLGCYPLDLFSGLTSQIPDEVSAMAERSNDSGVDESTAAVLRYGKVIATLDCSFNVPFVNNATILGTGGRITLPDVFRSDLAAGIGTLTLETDDGVQTFTEAGDQYRLEVEAFHEQIHAGGRGNLFNAQTRITLAATELVSQAVVQ